MATKVDIFNLALQRAKASSVENDTDTSPSGVECRTVYDHLRRSLLETIPWGFAKKTIALADTGNTPNDWTYEYSWPNDALQIRYILPVEGGGQNLQVIEPGGYPWRADHEAVPYEITANTDGTLRLIQTDKASAYACYTKNITAETMFPTLFTDALAWRMAVDLATPLGGDSADRLKVDALKGYREAMDLAAAQNGNQRQMGRQRMARNMQARHSVYAGDPYWRYR